MSGTGIRLQDERAIFNWFYTSQIPDNSPSYTFSGTFGGVLAVCNCFEALPFQLKGSFFNSSLWHIP